MHKISDKAIQIAAYWEAKGIWRPIRQEEEDQVPINNLVKPIISVFTVL
jgi:hypothetical protein